MASPPALGEVAPGQLLVDPQSLTIWVGVDTSVDSHGALLICDMQQLAAADATTLTQAKAYTDGRLNGTIPTSGGVAYSQTNHTHTASQITNFNEAVNAAIGSSAIPRGAIMLWSGNAGEVGIGVLIDWRVCNGNNDPVWGTYLPDLRNKFVLGSGDGAPYPPTWNTGPQYLGVDGDKPDALPTRRVATDGGGAHNHTGNTGVHALTVTEMPKHRHNFVVNYPPGGFTPSTTRVLVRMDSTSQNAWDITTTGPDYTEAFMNDTGGDGQHSHTIALELAHAHGILVQPVSVPFYALCYIIKVR